MKRISTNSLRTSIALFFIFSTTLIYGQQIKNNHQTTTLEIPFDRVQLYFDHFNKFNHSNYPLIYNLKETNIDTIIQQAHKTTIYLSENKTYESALIATNKVEYNKYIQGESSKAGLFILAKADLNAEERNHPIKPYLSASYHQSGLLYWNIEIEALDENHTQLTFSFNSLDPKHKKAFIKHFSTPKYKDGYNYTFQELYIPETFSQVILDYLDTAHNRVYFNADPAR